MSEQPEQLQNEFLNNLRKGRVPVSIFLVNGIRLAGQIQSFDQYSIRLHGTPPQLVFKRVIATVLPDTRGPRPPPCERSERSDPSERTARPTRARGPGAP